jgi:cytochrome c553
MTRCSAILSVALMWAAPVGIACADFHAKEAYLADCARCHGPDGKGDVAAMKEVSGYKSVDLTQLSKENQGQFPSQRVWRAVSVLRRILSATCPRGASNIAMMRSLVRRAKRT